jgi:hypothetical protein
MQSQRVIIFLSYKFHVRVFTQYRLQIFIELRQLIREIQIAKSLPTPYPSFLNTRRAREIALFTLVVCAIATEPNESVRQLHANPPSSALTAD